jgi:hypothetical protein
MSTTAAVIFCLALVFYVLTWKYIRQFVRDVNAKATENRVSIWGWHKGWRIHSQFFPTSSVRSRLVACIALTVGLGLVAFCIEARNMFVQLSDDCITTSAP